jgi:magnesium transporter
MTTKLSDQNLREPVSKHMRKGFVALRQDETVGQVMKSLRTHDGTSEILYLYVTDEQDRLVGVVPVRNVLTSDPQAKVLSIMVTSPVSVQAAQTVLRACELFSEHRLLALPVVDDSNRIIGIVDINLFTDEVVSLAQQRQVNNVFQLIGVHISLGKPVSSWADFRGRFPWLSCNIISGIICAFIASRYELLISEVIVLAMFITVVLALAESVSIQSMTLTLQVFLQQQVSWHRIFTRVRKEILISAMLGAGAGIAVGATAFLWKHNFLEGLAVAASIWLSVITACLLGVIVPTAIRTLRIDPKVAAGPIVLATADIATILFYFTTAAWLLG